MKIYTKKLRDYSKLINLIKDQDNPVFENMYFDFENNYVYVSNRFEKLRLKFLWEKEREDEVTKNVFININKFMPIVNNYDEIFFDGVMFYNNKNEKFKFDLLNTSFDNNNYFNFNEDEKLDIEYSKEFVETLKRAIVVTHKDVDNNLNGVFFGQGFVYSSDGSKIFQCKLNSIKEDLSFSLPNKVVYMLLLLGERDNVSIYKSESCIMVKIGNELELLSMINSNLTFINGLDDLNSQEYVEAYNHSSFILFDKKEMLEVLRFIESYLPVNENLKRRIFVEIKGCDDGGESRTALIKVTDENEVVKKISLGDCSDDLLGGYVSLVFDNLKQAISLLYDGAIKIQMKSNPNDYKLLNVSNAEIADGIEIKLRKLKISENLIDK